MAGEYLRGLQQISVTRCLRTRAHQAGFRACTGGQHPIQACVTIFGPSAIARKGLTACFFSIRIAFVFSCLQVLHIAAGCTSRLTGLIGLLAYSF